MNVSTNYVSDIVDEIALEGLDGITLDALWKRLSARSNFCFRIDDNSKRFIWDVCTKLSNLKFYELPEARKRLQYYDFLTVQKKAEDANVELDLVYPYSSIKTDSYLFGSCKHYITRKNVTDKVSKMNLDAVEAMYSDKLVIVASQESRNLALLGNNCPPNLDFSKSRVQYDILERIGRCRSLGIPTHGKGSLQSIVEDSKSIFHYLKCLIKHKIVKKQSLFGSFQTNKNGSKIYLTRFYGEYMNEYQLILQTTVEELKLRPNYRMSYEDFYQLFDPDKRARVKKYSKTTAFRKYIAVSKLLPYREFFPNATQAEWEKKCKSGERMVRCLQLLDPNTEVADIFEKECDSDEDEINMSSDFFTTETYFKGIPLLHQTYHHIKNSDAHGVTIRELSEMMGLSRSFIRIMVKRLIHDKHCKSFEEINGRRHTKRYIVGENAKNIAAATEILQILTENEATKPEPDGSSMNLEDEKNLEEMNERKRDYQRLEEDKMPFRTLRRIGMIIKTIKAHRYRLFFQIYRYILDEEIKEGLRATACRMTVNRILQKLEKDGLIKIIDVMQKDEKNSPSIKLYTDPTFVFDDKLTEAVLHTHSTYKTIDTTRNSDEDIELEKQLCSVLLENLTEMKKMLRGIKYKSEKPCPKEARERELNCSPKFVRLNIIHDLLFHIIYDYTGIASKSQDELLRELSSTCEIDEDLRREMPKIYGTQLNCYLFVPPLHGREGVMPGWIPISDLLLRLPLSIFIKILRVNETTVELLRYLNHPVRKHFLVKDLPESLRRTIFHSMKFLASLFSDIRRLCFLGLVQFGMKCGKEQYQTLLYLNRNASLIDTTSSPPSYLHVPTDVEFPVKRYAFATKSDIKKYWQDMCHICLATNLGVKANMIGKEVLAVRELGKESLRRLTEPKTASKAAEDDNGDMPGDRSGAGGIDSAMFSFLRNNWIGPIKKSKEPPKPSPLVKVPVQKLGKELAKKKQMIHLQKSRLKKLIKLPEVSVPKPQVLSANDGKVAVATSKTRKVRERKLRIKRAKKTYYDEVDIEALKLKNTLRVNWSAAEDHLLLICKVAILYLCPNPRAFVRIPWSEVRCNLQRNLAESRNKTQKAIARRVKYMMKNQTTHRSVSLCLEELNQVPEIAERFDCKELLKQIKPSATNLSELQAQLYKKFHELVEHVRERFSKGAAFAAGVGDEEEDLLPDSLDDFRNNYETESDAKRSELSLKEIRENVIRAILLSSLSCRADKTSSAIQLFEIYRQYEDDELQNTVKKLNGDKVITVKKPNNSIFKNGKYLPLSHSPWKLSFLFQTLLNTKYSHNLYPDAYEFVTKLLESGDGFEVDLNDCNVPLFVLACIDLVTFRTTVPDQIIVLDSSSSMNEDAYAKMLNRYCEMLQFGNSDSKLVCTSGQLLTTVSSESRKRPADGNGRKDDDDDEDDDGGGGGEEGETGAKRIKLDDAGSGETGSGSWRVVLYMMREEAKKEISNFNGTRAQEFFVVNASQVHCSKVTGLEAYADELNSHVVGLFIRKIMSRYSVPLSLVSEDAVFEEFERGDAKDLPTLKKVLEFVYGKREMGATNGELRSRFECDALPRIVRHLVDAKIVIRTGMEETRYVGQKYSSPWILNSFRITRLEREKMKPSELSAVELPGERDADGGSEDGASATGKKKKKGIISSEDLKSDEYAPPSCSTESSNKVQMIIRPWIRIDGSLNRKVLDRFLGAVLGYVMTNPGVTVRSVMDKFSPTLTPVWTKDIIEILHDIGCVKFTTYIVVRRTTLFSEEEVSTSDAFTGLDDDDCVVVESKVDAIAILGLFIGKRTYSKDFLTD